MGFPVTAICGDKEFLCLTVDSYGFHNNDINCGYSVVEAIAELDMVGGFDFSNIYEDPSHHRHDWFVIKDERANALYEKYCYFKSCGDCHKELDKETVERYSIKGRIF